MTEVFCELDWPRERDSQFEHLGDILHKLHKVGHRRDHVAFLAFVLGRLRFYG